MPSDFTFTGTSFSTLDSSSGIESLAPGVNRPSPCRLSTAFNVRYTPSGGVKNRDGYTELVDLATSNKVDDCESMTQYKVTFWKSGTSVFQATKEGLDSGIVYTIGVTRTASEKDFIFSHEKNVFLTNETDAFTRVAVSRVTAINSGAGTFSLETGDGEFFSSATVYIRGTAVTGGTLSGDSFTGCTGLTGSMAIGDIVTQSSEPVGAPKGYCMSELEGSALIGKGTTLFASLPSSDSEPELFWNFNLSDGATAKRLSSNIRCIKTGLGVSLIGMSDGIDVVTGFEVNTGAILSFPLSRAHKVANNRSIVETDKYFVILTDQGRILLAMNSQNGFQLVDDGKQSFDFAVSGYVQRNKDQTDNSKNFVSYNPITKLLKICMLMKSGLTEEIVCQMETNAWSIDNSKNMRCRLCIQGDEYAGDDTEDKIHRDEYGTTDNGAPIISRFSTGRLRLGRKGVTGDYLNLVYGGVMSENAQFYQRIIYNDAVEEELIMGEDLVESGQMSLESGISLGEGEFGAESLGGDGLETEVFTFNYPYEMMAEAEYVQLEWEIADEGSKVEIRYFDLSGETENELLLNPA